jgi:2'-5' RNA ligase
MRTFVALPLPVDFKISLQESLTVLYRNHRNLRWVADENLHITLAFLGELDAAGVPLLIDVVNEAAGQTKSIPVSAGELFILPQEKSAGNFSSNVLALGFERGGGEMAALAKKIESGLEKITVDGLYEFRRRARRPFTAHLTLARKGREAMRLSADEPKMSFGLENNLETNAESIIDRVVVFKSELYRGGARYTALAEFDLQ